LELLERLPWGTWEGLAGRVRDRLLLARLTGAAVWLAWLVSLALGGWRHDVKSHRVGADHVQYYAVGQLLDEGRAEEIYDLPRLAERQKEVGGPGWKGVLPFRYPPFYSLCFALTSRLSYEASFLLWTALSLAGLALAGRLLGVPEASWLGWALCFYPVFAAVSFGQNSLFSLLLLASAFALWRRDRGFLAGLAAGLLLYKPQLLVGVGLLWLLDVRRSWRCLLGMASSGGVLALVSVLVLPEASQAFVASLGANLKMQDRLALAQQCSSQGFWMLLLPGRERLAHPLSLLTSLAGLAVFVIAWRNLRESKPRAFALVVLITPWLTPYLMLYDWSILLVPAALLWWDAPQHRDRWLVLFALVWLVALLGGPLVRGQLELSDFALQLNAPLLVFTVLAACRALGPSPREAPSTG
jgi:hypothetical protein